MTEAGEGAAPVDRTGPRGMRDPAVLTRREALRLAAGAAAGLTLGACRVGGTPGGTTRALASPIHDSSATAMAAAIRSGALTATELVELCLARIEAVNPALNAVVALRAEGALAEARTADQRAGRADWLGPLHGVPMTIKDSLDTADLVTTGGLLGRAGFVPERDATVVRRLREAGAILLGKTNTPELTLSYETDNGVYGRTSNPYDPERTSGGSSGGAAAVIAAGGAPFDIGSDYGGSIRLPAHFNGIAGIKPTHGRVSRAGHVFPFGGSHDSFQQIGPLARWVEDLEPLLRIIAGPDHIDPAVVPMPLGDPRAVDPSELRIGFYTSDGVSEPTAEIRSAVESAAAVFDGVGAPVSERRPEGIQQAVDVGWRFFAADGGLRAGRLREAAGQQRTGSADAAADPAALDRLFEEWYTARSAMAGYLDEHDVVLCPVNAQPAPRHGELAFQDASYTVAYNVTGWPAAVVRAGTSPEGLPIGVQIVAAPGREDRALAVAAVLETELGGFRPPSL